MRGPPDFFLALVVTGVSHILQLEHAAYDRQALAFLPS